MKIHILTRQQGVRALKPLRSEARVRVVSMKRVSKGVSPERFWQAGTNQGSSKKVAYGAIGTFRHTVQLRSVWWSRNMFDPVNPKVLFKGSRDVLSTVVGGETQNGM